MSSADRQIGLDQRFFALLARFCADPSASTCLEAPVRLVVSDMPGGVYVLVPGKSEEGTGPKAFQVTAGESIPSGSYSCTVSADQSTWAGIMDGSTNPQAEYIQGKLSVSGSLQVALGLCEVFSVEDHF